MLDEPLGITLCRPQGLGALRASKGDGWLRPGAPIETFATLFSGAGTALDLAPMLVSFKSLWDKIKGEAPFPWRAESEKYGAYISDANGRPVARVFGPIREARARAEFIVEACNGSISRADTSRSEAESPSSRS
jgi:hypothetical protein